MTLGDALNSLVNVVVGMFLGMAAHGLANLIGAGHWVTALLVIVPFVVLALFVQVFDGVIERLFPSGVRPARVPAAPRRKPLARILSLPAGFLLGVLVAALGLSDRILGVL